MVDGVSRFTITFREPVTLKMIDLLNQRAAEERVRVVPQRYREEDEGARTPPS